MRAYGKIETTFWQNPKVKRLSEGGRMLLLYLLSCPHGNSVGCFVLADGYIMADLKWDAERVSEHVRELVSEGFLERDPDTDLTRICGWWGHNTIENGNVAKAALKTFRHLPRGEVFTNAVNDLNALRNKFVNGLRNEFGDVFATPEPEPEPKVPPSEDAGASVVSLDAEVYRFGKSVLGPKSGGVITKLRQKCDDDLERVMDLLVKAQGKEDPSEWIGAIIRGERAVTAEQFAEEVDAQYRQWGVL